MTGLTEGRSGLTAFARRLVLISRPTSRFLIYSLSPLMFLGLAIVVALVMRAARSDEDHVTATAGGHL